MQSVWVLTEELPYEGNIVVAVFTSEAAVENYVDTHSPIIGVVWDWQEFDVW